MLTGDNKSKIDKIWDAFWSGGISDPLRVIEQISFLLFIKRLDDLHTGREKQANRLNKPIKEPIFAVGQDHLRWSRFREFEAEYRELSRHTVSRSALEDQNTLFNSLLQCAFKGEQYL